MKFHFQGVIDPFHVCDNVAQLERQKKIILSLRELKITYCISLQFNFICIDVKWVYLQNLFETSTFFYSRGCTNIEIYPNYYILTYVDISMYIFTSFIISVMANNLILNIIYFLRWQTKQSSNRYLCCHAMFIRMRCVTIQIKVVINKYSATKA